MSAPLDGGRRRAVDRNPPGPLPRDLLAPPPRPARLPGDRHAPGRVAQDGEVPDVAGDGAAEGTAGAAPRSSRHSHEPPPLPAGLAPPTALHTRRPFRGFLSGA